MLVPLRGRRAQHGGRGPARRGDLQQLRLDVVDGLGQVEVEVGLVRVLAIVNNLQGQLQSLVAPHRVLVQISMMK